MSFLVVFHIFIGTLFQHYESLLSEAKSRRESSLSKAAEMAEVTMTQNLQDQIEEITKETKAAADVSCRSYLGLCDSGSQCF